MEIINSNFQIEEFSRKQILERMIQDLDIQEVLAEEIVSSVLKNLSGVAKISTDIIRSNIVLELQNRSLIKEKNLYLKLEENKRMKFYLDSSFLNAYRNQQPEWGPLGYVLYKQHYARRINGHTEEFFDTAKRVVEGCYSIQKQHCLKLRLPWEEVKAQESAKEMFEKIYEFRFLPPGRGLWIMGTKYIELNGAMALNNCGFVSTQDIDRRFSFPFVWAMDALMVGVGIGFDTKGAGKIIIKEPAKTDSEYIIPDSRKGWTESLRILLGAYFNGTELPKFNYSKIRLKGSLIKGFGGVSSGPEPLIELHEFINSLLSKIIGQKITEEIIVDIFNYIGRIVAAGNVRRSAEIAIGSPNNKFLSIKSDKKKVESHRWTGNISVFVDRDTNYDEIVNHIVLNGEPGLVWMDNIRNYSRMIDPPDYKDKNAMGVNPCGEQTLESYELCCLSEVFISLHSNYNEFERTLKYAYLYAKSVTLLNTEWEITNAVMLKNRRIGISLTGIIDAINRFGREQIIDWLQKGYAYLKKLDSIYSGWLCVPQSIKITTVKPSGTVSLLPGVSPGIHYPYSEYYIRRVRFADNDDILRILKDANYTIEKDTYSPNTSVVLFPVHHNHFRKSIDEVSIWEQFENIAMMQRYWSDNNVSATVMFKEEEEKDIVSCLEIFQDRIKSVSLFPIDTKFYKQPPFEKIDEEKYNMMNNELQYTGIISTNKDPVGDKYCSNDSCGITKPSP